MGIKSTSPYMKKPFPGPIVSSERIKIIIIMMIIIKLQITLMLNSINV